MKTIILTVIVLFSFSNINAQDTTSIELNTEETKSIKNTKVDFYETLVAVNNFDIKIKKNEKTVAKIETKSDFYKNLMIKNGFTTGDSNTRLANNDTKQKDTTITDTTQITGLLP
ncbi:hypothetical protein [Aquimarina sp. 2201CG14-23]|uniref:hypothetical protein n=1 Tax=Aquimarina mycalae TaxID=3040073 RepID=UPI0024782404|nr:hypothetical protein [Aquimarina sp. 2201CG14-23]MDH7444579.1 hypothetical protein [Aquimarina sp. 2201CG14-23]